MARFKSEAQRKAVMARLRYSTVARRHPFLASYGASSLAGIPAGLLIAMGPLALRGSPMTARQGLKIYRTARKLYPQTAKLLKTKGGGGFLHKGGIAKTISDATGSAFVSGRIGRAGKYTSLLSALATKLGSKYPQIFDPMRDIVQFTRKTRPALVMPSRVKPAIFAHELGHAAYYLGRFGRAKQAIGGASLPLVKEGTAVLGSLAAHPVIARLPLSEKRKRKLHLAAGALPFAAAAPMLTDEALASFKGLKILKRVGISKGHLKAARRSLAGAYGTYLGLTLPGFTTAAVAARLYRKRSRERQRWR